MRGITYDDPFFQNYSWIAMLDPVELADGAGRWTDRPEPHPLDIDALAEVDHQGRAAWEAVVRPRPSYDPRCSCCALLFSRKVCRSLFEEGDPNNPELDPTFRFPDAHRVRLDAETGVCVLIEQVGGSRPGAGHDLCIEAVDEPMGDELFVALHRPRRRWLRGR